METKKNIHAGHRERMLKNFLYSEGYSPTNIQYLEMLLFYCIPRVDTNPIAHALLDRFGSIPAVFAASKEELKEINGIGDAAAEKILLLSDFLNRYTELEKNIARNKKLSKKVIADTIIHSVGSVNDSTCRDVCFILLRFDMAGRLLEKRGFRDSIYENATIFKSNGRLYECETLTVLCIIDKAIENNRSAEKEFSLTSVKELKMHQIDILAFLSPLLTIRFEAVK